MKPPVCFTRVWPVVIGLLLWLALAASPAWAHASLMQSYPAPGEVVPPMLAEMRLVFDEPLGPSSTLFVFTTGFQTVPGITATIDSNIIRAKVSAPLASGRYTLQWTATSIDGDTVEGSYPFEVNLWGWLMGQLLNGLPIIVGLAIVAGMWQAFRQRQRRDLKRRSTGHQISATTAIT